jgi:hypothetical protein
MCYRTTQKVSTSVCQISSRVNFTNLWHLPLLLPFSHDTIKSIFLLLYQSRGLALFLRSRSEPVFIKCLRIGSVWPFRSQWIWLHVIDHFLYIWQCLCPCIHLCVVDFLWLFICLTGKDYWSNSERPHCRLRDSAVFTVCVLTGISFHFMNLNTVLLASYFSILCSLQRRNSLKFQLPKIKHLGFCSQC